MSVPVVLSEAEKAFLDDYDALRGALPGADLAWLTTLRDNAIEAFGRLGLPHRRVEEWKYTDVKNRVRGSLHGGGAGGPVSGELLALDPFAHIDTYVMAFVNGAFNADLSAMEGLPDGVTLVSLREALASGEEWLEGAFTKVDDGGENGVQALNLSLFGDGLVLRLGDGVTLDKPVRMLSVGTQGTAHLRSVVVLGQGAEATLLESHIGAEGEARLGTFGLDIGLGEGAKFTHVKAQADSENALHLSSSAAYLAEGANYDGLTLTTGGELTRNEGLICFDGPGAYGSIKGISLLKDKQHCDYTTFVDHAVPDCESHELFKTVLADKARGVFQGKILVQRDAQRTDGYQLSQGLLLTPGTECDTKPELEIYADDVKCSHGATIGALDDKAIFFLRARGIPEGEAKALLVGAFVSEALDLVGDEAVRNALHAHVEGWLAVNKGRIEKASSQAAFANGEEGSDA